jgi:ankyrin repeat protein/beta-lactamase regulating signal transducer with metallopeptidase domain
METYLNRITDYILTQSWQIAILVAVVTLMNLALRNRSAHVRYLLWLVILAKCLVPPLLTVPLAVLPQDKPMPAPILERPVATEAPPVPVPSTPVRPTLPERAVAARPARLNPHQWFALAWMGGVAVFVLIAAVKALRTQLWLKRKRKALPVDLHVWITGMFNDLGLKRYPKVWLVEGIGQPFVWGLLQGGIYLPANFAEVNIAEHRRGILGHELSHILRFDAAVNLLQTIAQALFWFHPFVWWANKRIRAEREKCCDEMVIARLNAQVRDYSKAIVDAIVTEYESTRPIPSLAIAGPVKNIEERIKAMLRPGKKFYKRPSLVASIVVLLIAFLTVPTALVLTAQAQEKTTAAPTAKDKAAATAALFRAIPDNRTVRRNTVERMRLAIIQGADLEAKNSKGYTPLHAAVRAYGNNFEVIRLLLEAGANPNARNRRGQIPLHHIVVSRNLSRVKLLVSAGSDVNARDKRGMTPATIALELGQTDMFDLMAAQGATISTDLMSAYKGDLERVQSLIEDGKTQETFEQGLTLLHAAAAAGHTEIAEVLLRNGLDVRSQTQEGYTALHHAAAGNHRKVAELLLAKGADINGPPGKQTPLHWAIRENHKAMIEWLLVKGGNPNADGGRATPLQWAVWYWNVDIAALLSSHGGNIHLKTQNYPWTPLHEAVMGGHRAMVDALVTKTGDTIAAQWAPLHAAVASGDRQAVEDLLAKGADVNAKGEGGNAKGEGGLSTLHVAAGKGHKDIAELLITRGADVNEKAKFDDWKHGGWTPLYFAIWQGHSDVAELLVAKGADVNVKDERNLMPLHLALYGWPIDLAELLIVAELLIARDADVNAKGTWGQTPLHIAAGKGYTDIIRMLLDKGANPNVKENERGKTPLHEAAKNGQKAVAELLISKDVDVNAKTRDGKTPMSLAKEKRHKEIIELLRKHGAKE